MGGVQTDFGVSAELKKQQKVMEGLLRSHFGSPKCAIEVAEHAAQRNNSA